LQRRTAYPQHYAHGRLALHFETYFETLTGEHIDAFKQPLVAGSRGTWVLNVTNHEADLAAGAAIALVRFDAQIAFDLQTDSPRGRDYCVLASESRAQLHLSAGRSSVNLLTVHVEAGVLRKGDSFTIRIGDRTRGGMGSEVFWSSTEAQFLLAVAQPNQELFEGVAGNPHSLHITHHPVAHLVRLLGPTVVAPGEPFAMHVGVFDRNRNLIENYEGHVEFIPPEHVWRLPDTYSFSATDGGLKIFEKVSIEKPGVYRIPCHGEAGNFHSNPIVVQENPRTRIYWGDVHAHGWGDSTMHLMHLPSPKLTPLSRQRQARDIGRLDFSCPAAMSMDPEKRDSIWRPYRDACDEMDEPGRYVPFLAYEAHPQEGDRQIFFKNYDEPTPPSMRLPLPQLEEHYDRRDDVFLQVHIGGAPPRWDLHRPRRERLLEISSGFGNAEWLLQKALGLGYRPAICGASDLHLGLMGGPRAVETFRGRFGQKYPMRQRDAAYGTGPLTAICSSELSRDYLWHALETRRTYATSGARIYVDASVNGQPMGAQVPVRDALRIHCTAHACATIERVDLICGAYRLHTWRPGTLDFKVDLNLEPAQLPGAWIYFRLQQTDGEYAWTTPIYIEHPNGVPAADKQPAWNEDGPLNMRPGAGSAAESHLPQLQRYLRREEDFARFSELTPVGVFATSPGRCALFYCYWGEEKLPMSIRWFYEFEIPKIRFDFGWRDYGAFDELELGPQLMDKYADT
jgi:hypothetical protein